MEKMKRMLSAIVAVLGFVEGIAGSLASDDSVLTEVASPDTLEHVQAAMTNAPPGHLLDERCLEAADAVARATSSKVGSADFEFNFIDIIRQGQQSGDSVRLKCGDKEMSPYLTAT
ncbi:MAG: hypothetical protein J2P49_08875 [Methylocapsa sp.]|nr:hypothetical protein [Methylocapsa sp.]